MRCLKYLFCLYLVAPWLAAQSIVLSSSSSLDLRYVYCEIKNGNLKAYFADQKNMEKGNFLTIYLEDFTKTLKQSPQQTEFKFPLVKGLGGDVSLHLVSKGTFRNNGNCSVDVAIFNWGIALTPSCDTFNVSSKSVLALEPIKISYPAPSQFICFSEK